jgi:hypothetical protein
MHNPALARPPLSGRETAARDARRYAYIFMQNSNLPSDFADTESRSGKLKRA